MSHKPAIIILGPTASGKTKIAVQLAGRLNGEIISADSRQVYKGMDIGTGKDLEEYSMGRLKIPYHLIGIAEPGEKYNVSRFLNDASKAVASIHLKGRQPIVCGGTGFYIQTLLEGLSISSIPENTLLRKELSKQDKRVLIEQLNTYTITDYKTDIQSKKRIIRAIEIAEYRLNQPDVQNISKGIGTSAIIFGIAIDRETRRKKITQRLEKRLTNGLIEEIKNLHSSGLSYDQLTYYGLEYKFVTEHVMGILSYDQMFEQLNTAIHQFSKRQMTWFRKMERQGYHIHWIESSWSDEDKLSSILAILS